MKRILFTGIGLIVGILFSQVQFAEGGRARVAALTQDSATISRASSPTDPVRITKMRVAGIDVYFGQPFTGNENSLAGLIVDIKNTSDKTIVDLRLSVAFEGDGLTTRKIHLPLSYSGRLRPKETAEVTAPFANLGSLKAMLAKQGRVANFRRGEVKLQLAKFQDGSVWVKGVTLGPHNPRTLRRQRI